MLRRKGWRRGDHKQEACTGDALGRLKGGTWALAVAMGMEEQEQQMKLVSCRKQKACAYAENNMTVMFRVDVYFLLNA